MSGCIFCDIVAGRAPCKRVYEDDHLLAFHDIHPTAPIHVLVIPKRHVESLLTLTPQDTDLMGRLMVTLPVIARQLGLRGFKTHINSGRAGGQDVFHLHAHLLGR